MTLLQLLRLTLVFGFILSASSRGVSADETGSGDAPSSIDAQLEQLTTSVYCYCGCTRETIRVCVCLTARQVEEGFRSGLLAGGSVEQIRNEYIAKYGTQFSALMPPTGFNLLAYIMPVIIIVLIGAVIFVVIRTKTRSPSPSQPEPPTESPAISEEAQKQIEAELESLKQKR